MATLKRFRYRDPLQYLKQLRTIRLRDPLLFAASVCALRSGFFVCVLCKPPPAFVGMGSL